MPSIAERCEFSICDEDTIRLGLVDLHRGICRSVHTDAEKVAATVCTNHVNYRFLCVLDLVPTRSGRVEAGLFWFKTHPFIDPVSRSMKWYPIEYANAKVLKTYLLR